jgi:hypothetical protein
MTSNRFQCLGDSGAATVAQFNRQRRCRAQMCVVRRRATLDSLQGNRSHVPAALFVSVEIGWSWSLNTAFVRAVR